MSLGTGDPERFDCDDADDFIGAPDNPYYVDVDGDVEVDKDFGIEGDAAAVWLPFLSMRFWVFGSAFFGLFGTLATLLGLTTAGVTLGASIAVGVVTMLLGVDEDKVDDAFQVVRNALPSMEGKSRATLFVVPVNRFERI